MLEDPTLAADTVHQLDSTPSSHLYAVALKLPVFWPVSPEMEFKEFEPRFKSAKTRLKLSACLNLETFDTI